MDRDLSSNFKKPSSFLSITNDVICTAVSKAMRFATQSPGTIRTCEESTKKKSYPIVDPEKDALPEIPLDQVYWHDTVDDCWIVVYDRVFDITDFLQEHPGGDEVLMEHAGRDATLAFKGVGHSREALRALERYLVGILPPSERMYSHGGKKMLEMLTTGLSIAS